MKNGRFQVAILGAGWGVTGHLPAWRALPDVDVAAIGTAHKETAVAAAREHEIPRAVWDYRELVDDPDIDIINAATKPVPRYEIVMSALAAGKHVYSTLPFGVDLEQGGRILTRQQQARLVGAVDAQIQWAPALLRAKEMIEEGFLGDPFAATCNLHLSLFNRPPIDVRHKWHLEKAQGGSILHLCSYTLHPLVHLFGEIEEVAAQQAIGIQEWQLADGSQARPEMPDTATVLLRFRSGLMAQLNPSYVVPGATGFFFEAYGSRGRIVVRSPVFPDGAPTTQLYASAVGPQAAGVVQEEPVPIPERLFAVAGSAPASGSRVNIAVAHLFEDVLAAIREGREAAPSFRQAVAIQRVVAAINQSTERRAWVKLHDID